MREPLENYTPVEKVAILRLQWNARSLTGK